jgi:predicted Zn-dependent peptidase
VNNYNLSKNVILHVNKDNKYKNVSMFINFANVFTKENKLEKIVLANMMRKKSAKYDTQEKFTKELDELYGAKFIANTNSIGNVFNFTIVSSVLNTKFTDTNDLKKQVEFTMEVLFNPLINQEGLKDSLYLSKAQNTRKNDNPNTYAMSQLRKFIGKGTHYENSGIFEDADFDTINLDRINNVYTSMLKNDRIDIFVFGDVDEQLIIKYISDYNFQDRKIELDLKEKITIEKEFNIVETKKISQSTQILVYENNVSEDLNEKYQMLTANSMFGQSPTSMLFQEVREKNSLCYSIFSSVYYYEGLLMVITNIDDKNDKIVKDLVELQRDNMVSGNFDEEQLNSSKLLLCDSLNSSSDEIVSTFYFTLTSILLNKDRDIDKIIDVISAVNKENIVKVFSKLTYKGSYLLKPEVSENE